MDDQPPTDPGQTPEEPSDATATDPRQTSMTVADAAKALGLTSDAIRAKIRRGTMSGFKADDDTWRVIVDQPVGATPTDSRQTPEATTVSQGRTSADQPSDPHIQLIEHMEQEIEYLRTELAKRSRELATERERSDVLQREALGRVEALTATIGDRQTQQSATDGLPESVESTESDESRATGIVAWLRRLLGG